MTGNSLPQRNLGTLAHLAAHRGVTVRAARMWAEKGYLTLYKAHGVRGVVVDLDEADAALDALAAKGLIRPGYGTFGGQQVQPISAPVRRRAEVVQ